MAGPVEPTVEERLAAQKAQLELRYLNQVVSMLKGLEARLGDAVPAAFEDMMGTAIRQGWAARAAQHGILHAVTSCGFSKVWKCRESSVSKAAW